MGLLPRGQALAMAPNLAPCRLCKLGKSVNWMINYQLNLLSGECPVDGARLVLSSSGYMRRILGNKHTVISPKEVCSLGEKHHKLSSDIPED